MNFTRFNRIELLVPEDQLQPAIDTFSALLGVTFTTPELMGGNVIRSSIAWEAGIEIIAPHGDQSPMVGLLAQQNARGAIGPIVWEVADLSPIRELCKQQDIEIVYEFELDNGGRALYLAMEDCFGYTLSFIDKPLGAAEPATDSGALFKRINRVELLMEQNRLEPARQFFQALLGIEIDPLEYLPEHHVLTTIHREAKIELFGPGDEESVLHQLLASKGQLGKIGPIVWEVDDLDAFKQHALALGHKMIYEFEMEDRKQLCLSDDSLFGYTATFTEYF